MLKLHYAVALLLFAVPAQAIAGNTDENPDEVFSAVYERIGALPAKAARDPSVWARLEELKREPCDQKSITDLSQALDRLGYRREAANGLYKFVTNCGAPLLAFNRAIDIYLKLTDYRKPLKSLTNSCGAHPPTVRRIICAALPSKASAITSAR